MGKANGHYEDYDSKGHPVRETCSCFPRLTPASLLGMGLFFFFAAQLFTSTPFEKLGGGRKLLGEEDSISRVWTGSRVEVSKKSHAYLRGPMWNRTAKSFTTNIGAEYTSAINHRRQQVSVIWAITLLCMIPTMSCSSQSPPCSEPGRRVEGSTRMYNVFLPVSEKYCRAASQCHSSPHVLFSEHLKP